MSRAGLDKQPQDVARMFDTVARRYDLTNDILSMGMDRRWRTKVVRLIDPRPGELILDLAAGPGTSSVPIAAKGATVIPCDFSIGMLMVGRETRRTLPFVAGDGMRLPFDDATFDAVTISFGLRNFADPSGGLAELARVTKPGGRVVICEFSRPVFKPFARVYLNYLMRLLPWIATRVSSDPESYVYLAESIRDWPDQAALAQTMTRSGWASVRWHNLTGGIVALHHAIR